MILYLDTSALAKLYVAEEGSAVVRNAVERAALTATCEIAYLELRAALARRRRERVLRSADYRVAIAALDTDWPSFFALAVEMRLLRAAARMVERYGLRAYDGLHLAACLELKARAKEELTFACWDRPLLSAAVRARLAVLGETSP